MKFNKIAVLTASVLLSTTVVAQNVLDKNLIKPEVKSKQVQRDFAQTTDFGSYIVERELAYVPSSVVNTDMVISTKGSMSLVKTDNRIDQVIKGTLVKNILTNEFGTLSGNISVLLKDGVSADDIATETGLTVVTSYAGTQIAVLKVTGTQDIIEANKQLKLSGLVKVAKIEVLETIHIAH